MKRVIIASTQSLEEELRQLFESARSRVQYGDDFYMIYEEPYDYASGDYYTTQWIIGRDRNGLIELYSRRHYHDHTGYTGTSDFTSGYEDVAKKVAEIQPDLKKWTMYN